MDRITNESNLWLNAIKMEDEGNYLKAFSFYLEDSAECIKQNSLVRSGLSCSCAADCLVMLGNLAGARQLYAQTATIYENNANYVIGNSVREALWSYKESYEYFNLVCENEKAEYIYRKYISLSRKINPFFDERDVTESLRERKTALTMNPAHTTNMQLSADVDNVIKNFLNKIGSSPDNLSRPLLQRISDRFSMERNSHEKSLIN